MYACYNQRVYDGDLHLVTIKDFNDMITSRFCSSTPNNINDMLNLYEIVCNHFNEYSLKAVLKGGIIADILTNTMPCGDLDVQISCNDHTSIIELINIRSLYLKINEYKFSLPEKDINIMDELPITCEDVVFHRYDKVCYKLKHIKSYHFGELEHSVTVLDTFSLIRFYLPVYCKGEILKYYENRKQKQINCIKLKYLFLDISFVTSSNKDYIIYPYNNYNLYIKPIDQIISNQYLTLLFSLVTNHKLEKRLNRVKKLCKLHYNHTVIDYDIDIDTTKLSRLFIKLELISIKYLPDILMKLLSLGYIEIDIVGLARTKTHHDYKSHFINSVTKLCKTDFYR